jgi:hypothetical protein
LLVLTIIEGHARLNQAHQLSLPGSQPTLGRLRKLACPAIHEDCQRALNFIMDARVKPAHDKREAPITRMV